MKQILLYNFIIEFTAAIVLILFPDLIVLGGKIDTVGLNISRMYAIAAGSLGMFSYISYRYVKEHDAIRFFALTIIAFNLLIGFQLYGLHELGHLNHIGPICLHIGLGIIYTILYLRKI